MIDILEICNRLGQRYPFLLVDRVTEVEPLQRVVGYKNVSINEPYFNGHFPNNPIFPGVLIIEAMAQVGAFMFPPAKSGYLVAVDKVKFTGFVRPGDQLVTEAKFDSKVGQYAKVATVAKVDGKTVAKAVITYYMEYEEGEDE
jgi:3-hydroxyacyl-[acyl-carrier-protein] dehydratase